MKTFIATLSLAVIAIAPIFAQEMPAELKTKLEAKAAELNPNDVSKAKSWVSQQQTAWESIQSMTFNIDASDTDLIKQLAEKKYPLNYVSQESYISNQAMAASGLPEYKVQLGAIAYDAIRKKFEASENDNIEALVEVLQHAVTAKMEVDSISSDKFRPKTFALIKKVAAEEYPGNFVEQLKTIKEIIEGKRSDIIENDEEGENVPEQKKVLTNLELKNVALDAFTRQTYTTEGENRGIAVLTEIQGKKVMLIPFSCFTPGTTLSNARGEQLEYNENEIYASKELPFVIVFPKNLPEGYVPAKFINDKQYRDLVGTSPFVVGYIKQNITAYPVKINSINNTSVILSTFLPNTFAEGTMLIDPNTQETLSLVVESPARLRRVNWMERSEVNRLMRMLESESGRREAIRIDGFSKWEKFIPEKYYEQKLAVERLKLLSQEFLKLFTNTNLSDSENSTIIGETVKKHTKEFRTRMDRSLFERRYKTFMNDMSNIIKAELRNAENIDFYSAFTSEVDFYRGILNQVLKTYEQASKGQTFMRIVQEDLKRNQNR